MFKKFKDRLNEVSEEVKRDPRFINSIASVNNLAQQTYSAINKAEQPVKNGEFEPSFSQLQAEEEFSEAKTHKRSQSSDGLGSIFQSEAVRNLSTSASSPSLAGQMASNNFFSLTEEDDDKIESPVRSRRLSSGSNEANLFPIYESPTQTAFQPLLHDLDSTAGSEWEDDQSSQRLTSISKETLFQMLQKTRGRYHKYKGRYCDLVKAYQDLERENGKIKTVMQQTQDKALRRISELKEQCSLEQKAKRHLEEELRSDIEEKQHVIEALQTKVTLLKSGCKPENDENSLIDAEDSACLVDTSLVIKDSDKVTALEEKIKRLEGLLTKCKESIKANKQKTTALTEVKESLAKQVGDKETELNELQSQHLSTQSTLATAQKEIEGYKSKEQEAELQIAEVKMMMHQEMITKDEEIGKLRVDLKKTKESLDEKEGQLLVVSEELDNAKKQQINLENLLESEKAAALQEMSRGKSSALQALQTELNARHNLEKENLLELSKKELEEKLQMAQREKQREITLKEEEMQRKLAEKDEEGRLALEELELRLSSISAKDDSKNRLNQELELKISSLSGEKKQLQDELKKLKNELDSVCSQIKTELSEELEGLRNKNKETSEENESLKKNLDDKSKQLEQLESALKCIEEELEKQTQIKFSDNAEEEDSLKQKLTKLETILQEERHKFKESEQKFENLKLELNQVDENHNAAKKNLEKEVFDLKNREASLKCNEQQMISYQKELQDQISAFEKMETSLQTQVKELQVKIQEKEGDLLKLAEKNTEEIAKLKADIEMKIRHEREKENSHKELQMQSIEYQKKLQENLEKLEQELEEGKAKAKVHSLEVKKLSDRIEELTKELIESQEMSEERLVKITECQDRFESLQKECDDKESEIETKEKINSGLNQQLKEAQEICETVKEERAFEISQLNSELKSLTGNLKEAQMLKEEKDSNIKQLEDKITQLTSELNNKEEKFTKDLNEAKEQVNEKVAKIQQLEKNVSQLMSEVDDKEQVEFFQKEVESLKSELKSMVADKTKAEMELQSKEQSFLQIQTLSKEKESKIDSLESRLAETIEILSEKEREFEEKHSEIVTKEKRISELQEQLQEALESSEKIKEEKTFKISQLNSELENLTDCLKEAQNLKEEKDSKIKQLENQITQLTSDLDNNEQIENFQADIKFKDDEISNLLLQLEDSRSKFEKFEASQKILNTEWSEEMDTLKGKMASIQSEKVDILAEKDSEIEDLKSKCVNFIEDLEGLKRDLNQSQSDKAMQLNEFEENLVSLENQISHLKKSNQELQDQIASQNRQLEFSKEQNALQNQQETDHEKNLQNTVSKYESLLAEKSEEYDAEVSRIRSDSEAHLKKTIQDFKKQISDLHSELLEKSNLYQEVISNHEKELLSKQEELNLEIEAANKLYQSKLRELELANEEKIRNLEKIYKEENNSWNWEREGIDEDVVQEFIRTPTREQREQQLRQIEPATLSVTVNEQCNHSHTLEESSEFEYLKNVLYQYMLGKESLTLARVLATVVKFSPDELKEVIKHEEKKHSILASLGILPSH